MREEVQHVPDGLDPQLGESGSGAGTNPLHDGDGRVQRDARCWRWLPDWHRPGRVLLDRAFLGGGTSDQTLARFLRPLPALFSGESRVAEIRRADSGSRRGLATVLGFLKVDAKVTVQSANHRHILIALGSLQFEYLK
jgi:hypothetical protein